MNSGKKCENSWFSLFPVWTNKNLKYGFKMIVQTMVQICAKFLISRLKIGGAMAISLVAMATATLILFLDVVFGAHWGKNLVNIFFWISFDSFCSLCLFFREIKRKALIGNDDVIVLMMSSNLWCHNLGMSLNYVMSFWKLFNRQLEMLICFFIKLSRIKVLSNRNQCSVTS